MTATTPINYWTDYVSGSDSTGDGSELNPWKTMQKALNTIVKNTTYGDCINLKSDETIATTLSFSTYGIPSALGRLTFRSADGNVKTINCNGAYFVNQSASPASKSYTLYESLKFTNYSTYAFYYGTNHTRFVNCYFDRCQPGVFFGLGVKAEFESCYFDGTDGDLWNACTLFGFQDGATVHFTNCVFWNQMRLLLTNRGSFWFDNCVMHAGRRCNTNGLITAGIGYYAFGYRNITNCSIYKTTSVDFGSCVGITGTSDPGYGINIDRNIIVGFYTVNSYAIKFPLSSGQVMSVQRNGFYNNTVNVSLTGHYLSDWQREDLIFSANPFTDPENGDFSLTDAALAQMNAFSYPAASHLVGETYPYFGAVMPKYNPASFYRSNLHYYGV